MRWGEGKEEEGWRTSESNVLFVYSYLFDKERLSG